MASTLSSRTCSQLIGTHDETRIDLHLTRRQLFGLTAQGHRRRRRSRRCSGRTCWRPRRHGQARDPKTGGLAGLPHFAPKAKRVIFLHQSGGPSQLETFDYKPALAQYPGHADSRLGPQGQRVAQTMGQSSLPVARSLFTFAQHGQSGTWVSELLPHTAKIVDDITVIKTMNTEAINHDPAITFIQTGFQQPGRPSMGAWLSYGLGSENQNLPAFVVLLSQAHAINTDQPLFSRLWGERVPAVQLPGRAVPHRQRAGAVPRRSRRASRKTTRRQMLDAVAKLERDAARGVRRSGDRDAHRAVRDGVSHADVGAGPDGPVEGAGLGRSSCTARSRASPGTYAANCLLARRLAERNVRFIQLYHRGWDQHNDLPRDLALQCKGTDQPTAALDHRPEAARPARRHARRLGRRVRPDGLQPGQADRRELRPRPPPAQLLHVGGRRRHEARRRARRDRRLQLQRRRPTRCHVLRPAGDDPAPARASTTSS